VRDLAAGDLGHLRAFSLRITSADAPTCDAPGYCGDADFDNDGDTATDSDIETFFACMAGNCCPTCDGVDVNGDGDEGTDADIESFFRVLAGGTC
jgi:hypothetical protein